jgi:hypothetical protein
MGRQVDLSFSLMMSLLHVGLRLQVAQDFSNTAAENDHSADHALPDRPMQRITSAPAQNRYKINSTLSIAD